MIFYIPARLQVIAGTSVFSRLVGKGGGRMNAANTFLKFNYLLQPYFQNVGNTLIFEYLSKKSLTKIRISRKTIKMNKIVIFSWIINEKISPIRAIWLFQNLNCIDKEKFILVIQSCKKLFISPTPFLYRHTQKWFMDHGCMQS